MPPRATRSSARRTTSGGGSSSGLGGAAATAAAAAHAGAKGKQQSSLSFAGRVTKPSARTSSDKDKKEKSKNLEDKADKIQRADIVNNNADVASSDEKSSSTKSRPKRPRSDSDFQPVTGVQGLKDSDSLAPTTALAIRAQTDADAEEAEPVTEEEQTALKVPESQIKKYWAGKEAERTTPRVHQQGLSLHEKVLREFDMSAQFGNAIGIPRTRRWKLAHELGLAPPIEVLAVLIREDEKGRDSKVQRAHVDELMSSRFVIA